MNLNLKGKVAAITGGSEGIGRATALRLAGLGASVALCARRADVLEKFGAEIRAAGGTVMTCVADATKPEDMARFVAETVRQFGRIDIMVNNAGATGQAAFDTVDDAAWHKDIDAAREEAAAGAQIGTTRRGIGPAYEDKVGRRAIRVADLADPAALDLKLDRLLAHHKPLRLGLGLPEPDGAQLKRDLLAIAPQILAYAQPAWERLDQAVRLGRRILFEGAQGVMLDVDHGTYPFVTSSNVVSGQAAAGSGTGPGSINYVLGLAKAYTTRVGGGPFPTEQDNEIGQRLGTVGHEFGTNTGRARRCGWFDSVMVRQACAVSGVNGLALTKLDVLDGFDEIKVCTHYRIGDRVLNHFPAGMTEQAQVEPVYETIKGWKGSTRGARSWTQLPGEAVKYVRRLEELVGKPVALLSTSPEREDVILMRDPFEK